MDEIRAKLGFEGEICLLIAGWPIPRSLAMAEKLPLFNDSNEQLQGVEFVQLWLLISIWNGVFAEARTHLTLSRGNVAGRREAFVLLLKLVPFGNRSYS
jgi:hypothetical protein